MNLLDDYLEHIVPCTAFYDLPAQTAAFLTDRNTLSKIVMIEHRMHPDPFEIVYTSDPEFRITSWKDEFATFHTPVRKMTEINERGRYYFFLDDSYYSETGYFVVSAFPFPENAKAIFQMMNAVRAALRCNLEATAELLKNEHANFVSQIMHDSNSLINLNQDSALTDELRHRLRYQEDTNRNILMFIREPDVFRITVYPSDFISDSLDLIGLKTSDIRLEINPDVEEICIDLELLSRALNEIVKNAALAVDQETSRVTIQVEFVPPGSPFHTFRWLRIKVQDDGSGIHPDFLSQVIKPFFTTIKNEGGTGFGLTLAEKLVKAHNGVVQLKTVLNRGTTVSIYIPQDIP